MNDITTHNQISQTLCGTALSVETDHSTVELTTIEEMAVDNKGLVHGGFIFGLADYAAMIAVNDPNVVLGAAQVTFKKPIKVGETLKAEAKVVQTEDSKRLVDVFIKKGESLVFEGSFTCFVLQKHVLD